MIWEIYGAEAYLGSSPTKEVYYISNEIWSSITEDELKETGAKRETKRSYVKATQWKMKPNRQTENRALIAPKMNEKYKYKVTFGGS